MLKVLVVDDSKIYRSLITKALEGLEGATVVGTAENGKIALEFIKSNEVDLVTLDVEMEEMDGLETLRHIQEFNSKRPGKQIGAIMLSSLTTRGASITIQALQLGAFDFIAKPATVDATASLNLLKSGLVSKISQYMFQTKLSRNVSRTTSSGLVSPTSSFGRSSTATPTAAPPTPPPSRPRPTNIMRGPIRAVIVGVSTGGPKALNDIVTDLTINIKVPILVVQHMPSGFTKALADSLDKKSKYTVVEAQNGDVIQDGYMYIAPGGRHMVVATDPTTNKAILKVNDLPPEENCRPSVNMMFRSAAQVFGGNQIAVVLTGMGSDGSKALSPLKRAGALIVAQDEKSSVVWGMPGSAVQTGLVDEVLPLTQIPGYIQKNVKG